MGWGEKWKILIADDDEDVHNITRMVLHDLVYLGKGIEFFNAYSARECKEIIEEHPDIAVILLDVVMETEDAGLLLVNYIRNEKKLLSTRIILRTGQPGYAPERHVIENYDIDDYKNKSELTSQMLYTAVRSALKSFWDIRTIENSKLCLEKILKDSPDLFRAQSREELLKGILSQIFFLLSCPLGNGEAVGGNGFIVAFGKTGDPDSSFGMGRFEGMRSGYGQVLKGEALEALEQTRETRQNFFSGNFIFLCFSIRNKVLGIAFVEKQRPVSENLRSIIEFFAQHAAAAMESLTLYNQIRHSEKLTTVGQVAGGIFHDLINALSGINLSLQLLQEPEISLEKRKMLCQKLLSRFSWAGRMVQETFDFSRGIQEFSFNETGIKALLQPVLELLLPGAEKLNVILKKNVYFDGPVVADMDKIQRCIFNLCKNGLEAMEETGKERDRVLTISVENMGNSALFSISDNGCGITEDHIQKIFQPFFSHGKKEGTGLGLSMAKEIIEGHGSKLYINSKPGEGTTFSFDLKIAGS